MDYFNDLVALYAMNMINAHEIAANNPRLEFSVKYDPFNQSDRLFKKNYRLG